MNITASIQRQASDHRQTNLTALLALSLALLTLVVYWSVQHHEFLVWDDLEYVVENPHVRTGLSVDNVIWAFTSAHASNWHPLTWLSHMLDSTLYGLNPAGHHLNSLLLHLVNTVLLFFLFEGMTRARWQSAFVAAIFAIHPLHVESVAWVSERKDVLSAFFWILSSFAYLHYTRSQRLRTYLLCIGLFTLGLASKPMVVTLPFVFLLLDYWPLCRTRFLTSNGTGRSRIIDLVLEKLPFFALAALSCILTIFISKLHQAMAPAEALPLSIRIGNGLVSYSWYLIKIFWPSDFAFFYPHPLGSLSIWKVVGASLLLLSISLMVFKARIKYPYLLMGWLWYGITLLPVIGLVQVGSQAMANRYTYVPLIGISVMIAWGMAPVLQKPLSKKLAVWIMSGVILLLSLLTFLEIRPWRNGEILFQRALEVTSGNYTAHYQLGNEFMRKGKTELAIHHFSEAVRFRPDHFLAHYSLGMAKASQGRPDEALAHLRTGLELHPGDGGILTAMGDVYLTQDKFEEAITSYSEVLRIDPSRWKIHNNIGLAFLRNNMVSEAEKHFEEALRINPGEQKIRENLHLVRKKKRNEYP